MNEFIESFSKLSEQLIPILGATALVFVIVLIYKLIKMLGGLDATVEKTNKTIDMVDNSIDKIQAPLDTVVKVSHTVDKAHDATVNAVINAKDLVVKSAEEIKDKVRTLVNDKKDDTNDDESQGD